MPRISNRIRAKLASKNILLVDNNNEYIINILAKLLLSLATIVFIITSVVMIFNGLTSDYILIEPFEVPAKLAAQGYSSKMIVNKFKLEIEYINSNSIYKAENVKIHIPSSSMPDIIVPGSNNTLNSIIFSIKEKYNKPLIVVSGYVVEDNGKYKMMVNFRGNKKYKLTDDREYIACSNGNIDRMIQLGAEKVYLQTNPLIMVGYYISDGRYENAIRILQSAKTDPASKCVSNILWAEANTGLKRYEDVLGKIEIASQSTSNTTLKISSYRLWGEALRKLNRYDEALDKFKGLSRIDKTGSYPKYMIADILVLQGKFKESIPYLKSALDIDKDKPGIDKKAMIELTNTINSFTQLDNESLEPLKMKWNEIIYTKRSLIQLD